MLVTVDVTLVMPPGSIGVACVASKRNVISLVLVISCPLCITTS